MNITLNKKNITDGLMTVCIAEDDYRAGVEKRIKEYARKATIKGFRKGKVPNGMVKKMYGKSILMEEVNDLVSTSISKYIRDNKLQLIGEPLPNREKFHLTNWDIQKEFEFEFQLGLVDDFECVISSALQFDYPVITIDDKVMDDTVQGLTEQFGEVNNPETVELDDWIHGELKVGNGEKKPVHLHVKTLDSSIQKKIVGKKKEETIAITKNELSVLTKQLGEEIGNEDIVSQESICMLTLSSIIRTIPAILNKMLYDKVFGQGRVTTKKDFMDKVREMVEQNYKREADRFLDFLIQHHLVKNTPIAMPETFLQTWMATHSKEGDDPKKKHEEKVHEYRTALKWSLIKDKLTNKLTISIENEEVRNRAKMLITQQYGMASLGDKLDAIVDNYLSHENGAQFKTLYDQLKTEKILNAIKAKATISQRVMTLSEFKKLVEDKTASTS